MLEPGVTTDPTAVLSGDVVNGHANGDATALEQRVRRLEDTVAQLQNTEQMEERLVQRVAERVRQDVPVAVAQPAEASGRLARLPRALLPMAVTTIQPPVAEPVRADDESTLKKVWSLFDVFTELRTIWRMYVDPRYRLTWMGRVVPLLLGAAILTSWFWLPFAMSLALVSSTLATVYVKAADLILAFFLYKALSREARRYRDFFPDPPPTVR